DGLGRVDRFGDEARRAAAQADVVAAQYTAERPSGAGVSRGPVVSLAVGRNAAGHGGWGNIKGTAQRAGQTAGAGGQLFVHASRTYLQALTAHQTLVG